MRKSRREIRYARAREKNRAFVSLAKKTCDKLQSLNPPLVMCTDTGSSYIDLTESCSGSGSESDSDSFEPNTVTQNSDRAPESNQCCIVISDDETRLVVH